MIVNDEDILPVKEVIALGPPSKKIKSENAAAVFHIPQDKHSTKLPDPFPFPTNFPPKIMHALEMKAMLPNHSGRFYGVIARAVYAIKCYPTHAEYEQLGQQIIDKYPFLMSPVGEPYVRGFMQDFCWCDMLVFQQSHVGGLGAFALQ